MFAKFTIILMALSSAILVIECQEGIVPYEFCEMYYWTNNSYVTNYTINDSDFITAKAVMDFIRNSTSFQNNCNNRMLIFTPKRFIKRFPENQGYSVLYNITIKVKKVYLFNKSLLNDSLTDVIGQCTILGVSKAIFDKPLFDKYLTLTLNVSGRLLKIMITPSGPQGPGEPTCNIETPVCPTASKEISSTCVCKPGTYLGKNVTECHPCSKNTYQSQPAKTSCLPCPPRTTTLGKTGSISRSNCSVCQPGSYLDLKTTTCHPCPLHSYQDKTGQINCIRCPDGKITADISSSSSVDCMENCTQGLYYNYTSKTCVQCPLGKYQPFTGQDKCKKCPPGTITHEIGSVYLTSCTNCTSGSYYDTKIENCIFCPKNTFQDLFGAMECEPCPTGKVTSSPGAMTRADCVTENDLSKYVLKIALSIAAIVVLVVLIIAIKLFVDRRRIKKLMKKFKKNIEVFDNTYGNGNDEERDVENCTATLGHLEEKVLAGKLEIPRDCLQFTGVRLGRGNFGEVHEVLVKKPDEPEILCAAKMARGAKEGCHLAVQDMLEELDTHMKLEKNPNIVNLLGVCSSNDGPFYLVMEHCGIGCLSSFLKSQKETSDYVNTAKVGQLSIEWKLQRSLEICNGMKYLAEKRIVHRDLAARNVLLDNDMVAKVSDFGMAKDVYIKCYYKQKNEGDFPLRWMSIESIEELKFTEKSDVWSFGVLLWEIFTDSKRPYYSTINDEKVAQYILSGKKLKKPSQCPKSFYRIMLKCWSDKDCSRPQFQDLYEELDLYIKNDQHQKPEAVTMSMNSFKKRFNETKRGVSRKLSLRKQSTKNRKKSIDSEMSFPETPQSIKKRRRRESQDTGNGFELVDVLECDSDNVPSQQESDGNPAVIANGGQTGGTLTDDKNGKNIDPMCVISEQSLRLKEADSCEPNEAGSSTELNEVINGDELNEAKAIVNSNQDSNNVDLTHFDHTTVEPSNTQLTETADTDTDEGDSMRRETKL